MGDYKLRNHLSIKTQKINNNRRKEFEIILKFEPRSIYKPWNHVSKAYIKITECNIQSKWALIAVGKWSRKTAFISESWPLHARRDNQWILLWVLKWKWGKRKGFEFLQNVGKKVRNGIERFSINFEELLETQNTVSHCEAIITSTVYKGFCLNTQNQSNWEIKR